MKSIWGRGESQKFGGGTMMTKFGQNSAWVQTTNNTKPSPHCTPRIIISLQKLYAEQLKLVIQLSCLHVVIMHDAVS